MLCEVLRLCRLSQSGTGSYDNTNSETVGRRQTGEQSFLLLAVSIEQTLIPKTSLHNLSKLFRRNFLEPAVLTQCF